MTRRSGRSGRALSSRGGRSRTWSSGSSGRTRSRRGYTRSSGRYTRSGSSTRTGRGGTRLTGRGSRTARINRGDYISSRSNQIVDHIHALTSNKLTLTSSTTLVQLNRRDESSRVERDRVVTSRASYVGHGNWQIEINVRIVRVEVNTVKLSRTV